MTLVSEVMPHKLLAEMIDQKFVTVKPHPRADLWILTYTPTTQFEKRWNQVTMNSRGTITCGHPLEEGSTIHARSFPKFGNYSEYGPGTVFGELPLDEPIEVFTKVDGSLGIAYTLGGEVHIATKGSFGSVQAVEATRIYREKYADQVIPEGVTYLFEIVYPAGRIVVDYQGQSDLVLLAAIDNRTGLDRPLPAWPGPVVERHSFTSLQEVCERVATSDEWENTEGYVVRFASGQRTKLKFNEYLRLHKILTDVGPREVYQALVVYYMRPRGYTDEQVAYAARSNTEVLGELLKADDPMSALIEDVPDEFYGFVKKVIDELTAAYVVAYQEVMEAASTITAATRKEQSAQVEALRGVDTKMVYSVLAGIRIDQLVWRSLRPESNGSFWSSYE